MDIDTVYGVPLNPILYERKSLTLEEAVAAWLLKRSGEKFSNIAHRLGVNPMRLSEVFNRTRHPEAFDLAARQA